MGISIGSTTIGSIYLGSTKISEAYLGNVKVYSSGAPALPPYTLRLKFTEGVTPTFSKGTAVQVSISPNIWDLTYENTDWNNLLSNKSGLLEIIDGNTAGVVNMRFLCATRTSLTTVSLFDTSSVTNMSSMFSGCTSLLTIPLFDTSNVTNMAATFYECTSITSIPLLSTVKVTNMGGRIGNNTYRGTFENCYNVESGALALYQQASTQATPPTTHSLAFTNCGRDTVTGAAERAQIPTSWGGTMA